MIYLLQELEGCRFYFWFFCILLKRTLSGSDSTIESGSKISILYNLIFLAQSQRKKAKTDLE
jgi:hypothetical protein